MCIVANGTGQKLIHCPKAIGPADTIGGREQQGQ
jgi:hypothetical protein